MVHSDKKVTYDAIFDALTSRPTPDSEIFFEPVGSRVAIPAYFKQVMAAGLMRVVNLITGRGFEKDYKPKFNGSETA